MEKKAGSNEPPQKTTIKTKSKPKLGKKKHGGKRKGAGRKQKFDPGLAMRFETLCCARISIIQLANIREDDPFRMEAFTLVETWIKNEKKMISGRNKRKYKL